MSGSYEPNFVQQVKTGHHEKTNLPIVSSTQDPGGLIPVGLGFPASGSLIACMCTRLKSQHRTSVIVGAQTEADDPSDQA